MRLILIAAVAGLLGAAALAKDLPRRRADDSKTISAECAYLGPGYEKAPGSDTCIKIGGSVRVEGQVNPR